MSNFQEPRDRRFIAAAVLIGLIVVAGIFVVAVRVIGGGDNDTTSPSKNPTSTVKTAKSSSVCGLADGDQAIPTGAPDAQWSLTGKVATPASRVFGPGKVQGGLHTCFAHNPSGAVFAAANYYADTTNPRISDDLISSRIFNDANAAKAGGDEEEEEGPAYQITGFRVEDATEDRASVALVVKSSDGPTAGAQAAVTFTLGWQHGDWKIVVPATGQPPTTAIATLAGYTAWSGV